MASASLHSERLEVFQPSLEFLRGVISSDIQTCTVKLIQVGANPSHVYRVGLDYAANASGPSSVIIKSIAAHGRNDPYGSARELAVHREILRNLALPAPETLFVGRDAATGATILVMQDLEPQYYFPAPQHHWTWSEMRCLLQAYAHLHSVGSGLVHEVREAPWVYPPWHSFLQEIDLAPLIADLVERHNWDSLRGASSLIESTLLRASHYAQCDPTFLHNDAYPPNVALPVALDREAILIDWGMATWGQAELDLAYLYMQPYRSTRMIDRDTALALYWDCRSAFGDMVPPIDERVCRQHHADAVLALAMIPVAHRVARFPYPDGSAPQAYWRAMVGVLQEKIQTLVAMEQRLRLALLESAGEA